MDRQARKLASHREDGSEVGSEVGSNTDSDSDEKVCDLLVIDKSQSKFLEEAYSYSFYFICSSRNSIKMFH